MARNVNGEVHQVVRRDPRHFRATARYDAGRASTWWVLLLVLVLAAGAATWRLDLADPARERVEGLYERVLGEDEEPDPRADPAAVPPPPGLSLPALSDPEPVADPVDAGTAGEPSPTAVRRVLERRLGERRLGRRVSVAVAGATGAPAYAEGGALVPASTTKLLTSVAALRTIEPGTTFATTTVLRGNRLVVVGGGDPFLMRAPDAPGTTSVPARADITTLARLSAEELGERGVRRVRVGYDATLFSGPAFNPRWPDTYRGDVVSPITALWVDQGRPETGFGRVDDPAAVAAQVFAAALADAGVRVQGSPSPARGRGDEVAVVESAPVDDVVDRLLQVSDNEATEVLLRHVGLATGGAGSFVDGVRGVERVLERLGVPAPRRLYDGSGLSRENLLSPATLVGLLQAVVGAGEDDPVRAALGGLPVAGFSGSLTFRFDDAPPAAVGAVRAKTGTLSGVSSLAGTVVSRDGVPMVFALMLDRVREADEGFAQAALDSAAAALGACRCARGGSGAGGG